jgi:uncharacterized RDD family membrane protein YckC
VAREIGGWLTGPAVPAGATPGVRLGLPAEGPGSVAGTGARLGAFIVDAVVANLLVGLPYLFGVRYGPDARGFAILGVFLLVELIFDAASGQTFGKCLLGIRVIRVDGAGLASVPWLLLRTVLLGALIPAVVWDRDRRGLHDKAAGTVVVVDPNKAAAARRPARATKAAPRSAGRPGPARPAPAQPRRAPAKAARRKRRR